MEFLGLNGMKRLINNFKEWVLKITFEVDADGNLYVITPDK